jgi:hypothetical protein
VNYTFSAGWYEILTDTRDEEKAYICTYAVVSLDRNIQQREEEIR